MHLPTYSGKIEPYQPLATPLTLRAPQVHFTRIALAAAHVVSNPVAERAPWVNTPQIDWDGTLRFRHQLWDQGLGLAEAMDTAQRGMGVGWLTAKELIQRTLKEAKAHPLKPLVVCGAGTDQHPITELKNEHAIIAAYEEQIETIETAGGRAVIMASRALVALGSDSEVYLRVYDRLISQASQPIILHWLGDMFDPALKGYWGQPDLDLAIDVVINLIQSHPQKIDGIKLSLLSQPHEEKMRARLPAPVRMYTGDDFNYPQLIEGDGVLFSDALLGIFAAIAPAASQALEALALGDVQKYRSLLAPTVPLSLEIFKAPTRFYKAGIAFLSWLNGTQDHFIMPGGLQSAREITHYAEVFRLADQACLLLKPELAEQRMQLLMQLHGI